MGDDVRPRRVEPEKERLAVALGLVNKLEQQVENFVVHRLRSSACRSCPSAAVRSDRLYRDRTPSSPDELGRLLAQIAFVKRAHPGRPGGHALQMRWRAALASRPP